MKVKQSRRDFLKKSVQAAAGISLAPAIVPGHVFGQGRILPGNKITVGCIGMGNMGTSNMTQFLQLDDVKVVAVCDLDKTRKAEAKKLVDMSYGNSDCAVYHDFRELLQRDDIDAVSIATPDHWHGIVGIKAAKAGKDIYGEKPLTHNWAEGRVLCDTVKRYGRIWQTGSWQRSVANFRFASELVRNGRIGKVHTVEVGLPQGYGIRGEVGDTVAFSAPPAELDYDFWIGPAPELPYFEGRTHWNWRWQLEFGGGQLLDWVGHHVDIAHWGLGLDYDGPVEIEGVGEYPVKGPFNAATRYRIETRYANDLKMTIAGGYDDIRMGTKWIGDKGWVWVTRGDMAAFPNSLMRNKFTPDDIRLYHSVEHRRNFIDCVKSRRETIAPCEIAHRSATPGHLGQIAMRLGRKIHWDPQKEKILNDPAAAQLLSRPMRSPWQLS